MVKSVYADLGEREDWGGGENVNYVQLWFSCNYIMPHDNRNIYLWNCPKCGNLLKTHTYIQCRKAVDTKG